MQKATSSKKRAHTQSHTTHDAIMRHEWKYTVVVCSTLVLDVSALTIVPLADGTPLMTDGMCVFLAPGTLVTLAYLCNILVMKFALFFIADFALCTSAF